jgi:hypothetical protein
LHKIDKGEGGEGRWREEEGGGGRWREEEGGGGGGARWREVEGGKEVEGGMVIAVSLDQGEGARIMIIKRNVSGRRKKE